MMRERELWKPLDDYGTDDVYCISPPLVPEESIQIYDECVSRGKRGKFNVAQLDQLVYEAFNGWCPVDDEDDSTTTEDTTSPYTANPAQLPKPLYTPPLIVK